MGEEHPLTLGAVVARAQVVLGGVAVDLVVDEEVDLVVPNTAAWMLDPPRVRRVCGLEVQVEGRGCAADVVDTRKSESVRR